MQRRSPLGHKWYRSCCSRWGFGWFTEKIKCEEKVPNVESKMHLMVTMAVMFLSKGLSFERVSTGRLSRKPQLSRRRTWQIPYFDLNCYYNLIILCPGKEPVTETFEKTEWNRGTCKVVAQVLLRLSKQERRHWSSTGSCSSPWKLIPMTMVERWSWNDDLYHENGEEKSHWTSTGLSLYTIQA